MDVDATHLDFSDALYWEALTRSRGPIRMRLEALTGIGLGPCQGLGVWARLLQAVALPTGVALDTESCALVFVNGRAFASCAHVVLGRMCKQFPVDLWHLHFYVVRFQRLAHLVADRIALDLGSLQLV